MKEMLFPSRFMIASLSWKSRNGYYHIITMEYNLTQEIITFTYGEWKKRDIYKVNR